MHSDNTNSLIFEPVSRFFKFGDEIQICKTTVNSIDIFWRTVFHFNIFKEPSDSFTLDLTLPLSTFVPNGTMDTHGYFAEGFGNPTFTKLKHAIEFAQNFNPTKI